MVPFSMELQGYKLLLKLSYEKVAFVCASHILFGIEASKAVQLGLPACDFITRAIEDRLGPLIDLMIEGVHLTTLNRRFSSLRKRYVKNSFFINRLDRAQQSGISCLTQLSEEIGKSVEKLSRIRLKNRA